MAELIITKDNFQKEVIESEIPVLLDFWATWCGPCRMLSPIVSQIATEYEGKIKVGKVNVDDEEELASKFNVQSIPMVVLMKNGKIDKTTIGYRPKDQLLEILQID